MIPPGISSAIVHSTLLTIITHTSTHPGRPQPFNEFKPIEREIVPLILQPALSQQHETCYCFFIMILVSWLIRDEAANHEPSHNNFNSVNPTALIITLSLSALSLNSCASRREHHLLLIHTHYYRPPR